MLTPQPHKWELKPGSATFPFFGVQPCLMDPSTLDDEGYGEPGVAPVEMEGNGVSGHLCVKAPWPGMMRGLWGDDGKERYEKVYFSQFDGYYCAGDGSTRDEDGYYWVTGRTDDVLIVSGHNIGTAEVESACVLHESVAEAAVVGFPHEVKGNAIHAYITLNDGALASRPFASALPVLILNRVGQAWRARTSSRRSWTPRSRHPWGDLLSRNGSSGHRRCPRPGRARSCAEFFARSPTRTRSQSCSRAT